MTDTDGSTVDTHASALRMKYYGMGTQIRRNVDANQRLGSLPAPGGNTKRICKCTKKNNRTHRFALERRPTETRDGSSGPNRFISL